MKIQVGVFFGGKSVEHEISVISALQAMDAMDKDKYDIVPIYITKDHTMYTGDKLRDRVAYKDIDKLTATSRRVTLTREEKDVFLIDVSSSRFRRPWRVKLDVALPIVHGTNVEDGTLQGYLNMLGCPYAGCDVAASAVGMDKQLTKAVLKDHGLPVLDSLCFSRRSFYADVHKTVEAIEAAMTYPMIVKPANLGSSIGIKLAKKREDLIEAMTYALTFADRALIERAIENLREINCAVLGDADDAQASVCEEPINQDEILSYQDKYLQGGGKHKLATEDASSQGMASLQRLLPAPLDDHVKERIQKLAVEAFRAIGAAGVARIDFMIDTKTNVIYINELNTIPGSLSFYLWAYGDLSYKKLLDRMIELAFKRERDNKTLCFSFDTNILENDALGGPKSIGNS